MKMQWILGDLSGPSTTRHVHIAHDLLGRTQPHEIPNIIAEERGRHEVMPQNHSGTDRQVTRRALAINGLSHQEEDPPLKGFSRAAKLALLSSVSDLAGV